MNKSCRTTQKNRKKLKHGALLYVLQINNLKPHQSKIINSGSQLVFSPPLIESGALRITGKTVEEWRRNIIFRRVKSCTVTKKSDLCIPRIETVWPRSQFLHSCICERFIFFRDGSASLVAAKQADQSWEYINLSQLHECGNWETDHYNYVLEITGPRSFISGNTYIRFLPALHLQCGYNGQARTPDTKSTKSYGKNMSQLIIWLCFFYFPNQISSCVPQVRQISVCLFFQNFSLRKIVFT